MISVGIDVAKDKHDCFILNSDYEVLEDVFTIPNSHDGFVLLTKKIAACASPGEDVRVGLEATGHYSYNILGFLLANELDTYVLNPLSANLYRKSLTLRKTKTDRVDARNIAAMLISGKGLKPYRAEALRGEDLKSLTRYRFDKVRDRAKLKQSVSRLVCILFPELEKLVPTLHMTSVYALLESYPGARQVAGASEGELRELLAASSRNHLRDEMATKIREAAASSIGSDMPAKSMELQHTIRLIRELGAEIREVEASIGAIMDGLGSPITTIPGIGLNMAAMILAEAGDLSRFATPDKLLAYAGMSPSTYQSGQLKNCYPHMEKRGSRYLRYALYNATKYVCRWDPTFAAYLQKKRSEGKHYNVALSHATKKLVRLIFALERSRQPYRPAPAEKDGDAAA